MTIRTTRATGPHGGQPVLAAGAPLASARTAVVLLHGRGAGAADILSLGRVFGRDDVAYLAPQAEGATWYPYRFLEPQARNQPYLASALAVVTGLVEDVEAAGIPSSRIVLAGFSQGACLAVTAAARQPRRWGGVIGLSGGLIGTDGEIGHEGDLAGTPVILGCSDVDAHIPLARVQATTRVLAGMGADVDETIYPGMGHGIVEDEVRRIRELLARLGAAPVTGA